MNNIPELPLVALKTERGTSFYKYDTIACFTVSNKKTTAHFVIGINTIVYHSLAELETLLPVGLFFRCHYSSIINMGQLSNYNHKNGELLLQGNHKVMVSCRSRPLFKRLLTKMYPPP